MVYHKLCWATKAAEIASWVAGQRELRYLARTMLGERRNLARF